jgi:1-deoxy-D-xylulose-5-phosphate reductoisomerase
MTRLISVLGCTGSIGVSTMSLLAEGRASGALDIEILALTAGQNVARLAEQALIWRPAVAAIADETLLPELRARLEGSGVEATGGEAAVCEAAARKADWVMAAIVGVAGLRPTLAAARTGAVIGLANKESIVCADKVLLRAIAEAGGSLAPVDSEHSAVFQALGGLDGSLAAKIVLTSSGGPFRGWSREAMASASVEQATSHPNFSMGAKISVDSAQMMNKGLEIIEAAYLFGARPSAIEVLVHPQQIIHSMVEFVDGSTMAQLAPPDMRGPIACALAWPRRLAWKAPVLDLARIGALTFEAPDEDRFPALRLAREALKLGGGAPCALNAANEVAVGAFLNRRIGFLQIAEVVETVLTREAQSLSNDPPRDLEDVIETDRRARAIASDIILPSAHRN